MAKTVTNAVRCRDPIQHSFGPDRELYILVTSDGSIYEFQKLEDEPVWSLRGRGSVGAEPYEWTQSRARLPSSVIEMLDDQFGEKGWTK